MFEKSEDNLENQQGFSGDITGDGDSSSNDLAHFMCGYGASMANIVITFPINKLMFRQQLFGIRTKDACRQIYQEGALNLYRGLMPPLVQKSLSTSLMFGLYNFYHKRITKYAPNLNPLSATVLASMLAGTCEATLTPLERIQTLLQDPKYNERLRNTNSAFTQIRVEHGTTELFRGLTAILYRNGPSSALFFSLRKPIKERVKPVDDSKLMNAVADFVSGSMIGALCSTIFFPVNVVKTRMQSQLGGPFVSFSKTFMLVFNERNRSVRLLYRGMQLNMIRSFISWGIINTVYEAMLKSYMHFISCEQDDIGD